MANSSNLNNFFVILGSRIQLQTLQDLYRMMDQELQVLMHLPY
jgi:hypothetical protein